MIQNHADLLTACTLPDGRCGDHSRHVSGALAVDHDAKFTSDVFRAFVQSMGSCLIVGSAYHTNTNAKAERANDWDSHLTLAE